MPVEELPSAGERRSLVGRLVAGGGPSEGGRANPGALFAGVLAGGAFAVSLAYEWVTATLDASSRGEGEQETQVFTMHASVGSIDTLGLVYTLGVVLLLVTVGAAVSRPDLAARIRLPLLGGAGGLIAVLVALTIQLPTGYTAQQLGIGLYLPFEFRDRITTQVQPGLYFAYAAVLLPVVAVFLAAKPISRAQAEGPVDAGNGAEEVRETAWAPVRAQGATELTVSAADPHDHHGGTDVWRSR